MEKKQIYFIVNGTETTVEVTGQPLFELAETALTQVDVLRPFHDFQVIHCKGENGRTLDFKLTLEEQGVIDNDVIFLSLKAGVGASPSQPSEQKPKKATELNTFGDSILDHFDTLKREPLENVTQSEKGEQKPSERAEEISYRAWRTLVNSGWANVQGEILKAMQEYGLLERSRAIDECLKIAESISFDTEDQAGIKFVAVVLDELKEKLKSRQYPIFLPCLEISITKKSDINRCRIWKC